MPAKPANSTTTGSPLDPWALAVRAAWQLTRERGPAHLLRLGVAGLRTLGPKGLLHRAAHTIRQQDDDARYRAWLAAQEPSADHFRRLADEIARFTYRPCICAIVPVFNTDARLLRRCIDSVRGQLYPDWQLCVCDDGSTSAETAAALDDFRTDPRIRLVRSPVNGGIVQASNAALALATGEFVGFLDHDDELAPDALAEIARRLDMEPDLDVVYTDEDKIDAIGTRSEPHFKPDFSPAQLRSCMYISHFTVMRRARVIEAGGLRADYEGAQDYDLMLRVADRSSRIAHVPKVLYHWRRSPESAAASQLSKPWAIAAVRRALEDSLRRAGVEADVRPSEAAGHVLVRYRVRGAPRVSVLVTATGVLAGDGGAAWLRRVAAIAAATAYTPLEFVVACEAPLSDRVPRGVPAVSYAIVESGTSLPAQLNAAARLATGEHLLTLDPLAAPLDTNWLDVLVGFSQQREIGAVGALLLTRGRTLDHAGIVVGAGPVAAPALQGEPEWTRGHLGTALDVRNCSAVSGACLLTRRALFDEVGGFDEQLASLFDVDYGLRVRRAGLQVVIAPHARLRVPAPSYRLRDAPPAEIARLRATWGAAVEHDAYYNPHFDRHAATFRLPPAAPSPLDPGK